MSAVLTKLAIRNFRCFSDHIVEFQPKSLIVGKNNAGKSTCIEALRMVSLVTERMRNLPFRYPPAALDLPRRTKGLSPSLDSIAIHREGLFNRYRDPPAVITATFSNGARVEVYLGKALLFHAAIYDAGGTIVVSRRGIEKAEIPRVSILPQISPVAEEEQMLQDAYVRSHLQTSRCSLHFRNQLRLLSELLPHFRKLVSATWPGLSIDSLELPGALDTDKRLSLIVRDRDFAAEVAWMGHGLQMWLQTMWFLTRNQEASILILDEPDVYMHADLQRKLIRLLLQDPRQFIIATHSPEMLAEVQPESVIVLNRGRDVSKSATSSATVQELLKHVGSVHNISLSRLGMYGRILLVEGEDIKILKLFQNACDPTAATPIDAIPNSDIEGWSKWPSVVTMAKFLRRNAPGQVEIFCVFDRDYHTDEEVAARYEEAKVHHIHLHIWERKELENYIVCPAAVARVISTTSGKNVTTAEVGSVVESICDSMKDDTVDIVSEEIRRRDKEGVNKSNPIARAIVKDRWSKVGGAAVVGGKALMSAIAKWSQETYGVSLTIAAVVREMQVEEVPQEMAEYIAQVTNTLEHA